ncbi:MAG: AbrB/MazE/SpoVT family DNA-binding domain-containing protein [Candidatus Omnitrophica bacterium]|nr:AbrB/MazE/SpoVT family DNA-binding domain-containing protein [Candidatus Omnitrophota bacterium]
MTITMSAKNQVTIPTKIAKAIGARKGSIFSVRLKGGKIELVPLEVVEKVFTEEEYKKMDVLCKKERKDAKPVTDEFIDSL